MPVGIGCECSIRPSHYPDLSHAEDIRMRAFDQPEPLTGAELDRLGEFLRKCKGGKAMNIEELDGFFSAPHRWPRKWCHRASTCRKCFGGEVSDTCEFAGFDEANDILGLMMRHWNTVAAALHNEDVYLPILFEDENGVCLGNNWARGFIRGVDMRKESWAELMTDEETRRIDDSSTEPFTTSTTKNPEMRPGPIGPERREQIIVGMAAGIVGAYRYFRLHRQHAAGGYTSEPRSGHSPRLGGTSRARAVLARNTSVAAAAWTIH